MRDGVVVHNAADNRFELRVEGLLCRADYHRLDDVLHMTHTVVPKALEGRGLASKLVQAAVDYAQSEDLKIDPACSYVRTWLDRHPQYRDLLV